MKNLINLFFGEQRPAAFQIIWLLFRLHAGLSIAISFPAAAQSGRIDGNGQITTAIRTVDEFHAIEVEDYCNVEVTCGQMAKLEITIDENLLSRLKTQVRNGVLHIEADGWIEATKLQVKIGVPFLHRVSNGAWGKIVINNLDTRTFELNSEVGDVLLRGKTETLNITAGSGRVNALELDAREVNVRHESHAETKVSAREKLTVNLDDGAVFYTGNVARIDKKLAAGATLGPLNEFSSEPVPVYVTVSLKNNSAKKVSLEIKGPVGNRFSYGFDIGPFGTRKEKAPVGTRILNNKGETLVTIGADDDGKTRKLF